MWLYTTVGFFSVVQKRGQPDDMLTVRGRFRGDLEALREAYLPELGQVTVTRTADYAFRATVTKDAFARAMVRIVEALTYDNFKNEVSYRQGLDRAHTYHDVWEVMHVAQGQGLERVREVFAKGRKRARLPETLPLGAQGASLTFRRGPDGYLRSYTAEDGD